MYVSKSFSIIGAFLSNVPGTIAGLGELSPYGATYSKEKGIYSRPIDYPGVTLISMLSATDDVNSEMPDLVVNAGLLLANYMAAKTIATPGPYDRQALLTELVNLGASNNISSIGIGELVEYNNWFLPAWYEFSVTTLGQTNTNKVWMSDESFTQEYLEYDITVIPPIRPIDNFFLSAQTVAQLVSSVSVVDLMAEIQEAKERNPETVVRTLAFDWVDPIDPNNTIVTNWSFLIYGEAGNNEDAIRNHLIEWILENSTRTRAQWAEIFPDIFNVTEFVLMPQWDKVAISYAGGEGAIYSPFARTSTLTAALQAILPDYGNPHVLNYSQVMGHPYKSLAIGSIGSPSNRLNRYLLSEIFPDYISVSSTSADFIRMQESTRNWASMVADMLIVAETATQSTAAPAGMYKITRNDVLYIAKTYQNIQYLIATKASIG